MRRFGLLDEYAERSGSPFNIAVLIAWLAPVCVGLYLIFSQGLFAAYAVIPCWLFCGVLYLLLSKQFQGNLNRSEARS
jgi:NCS1 family nucleobase:cation symporter-1